jgi:hypothetical protein
MPGIKYGPVDLLFIGFEGERPGPAITEALVELIEDETISLLDLIFASRNDAGELTILEIDELPEGHDLADVALIEPGLAAMQDVEELAANIPAGSSAALLAVELTWARNFSSALAESGGTVLYEERIGAPLVNAILEDSGVEDPRVANATFDRDGE